MSLRSASLILATSIFVVLAACGDDDDGTGTAADAGPDTSVVDAGSDAGPSSYSIGVTVTGLAQSTGDPAHADAGAGGLVLANGADQLVIYQNGTYTFPTKVAANGTFNVTVVTQPSNPFQTCGVSGGSGTVVSGDVKSITVNCSPKTFTVGGTVTGLGGSGLKLRINDTEDVAINTVDGTYAFATALASGTKYAVVVKDDPTNRWQTCTLENATGVVANAKVENVNVTCVDKTFSISGTITGLKATGLSLTNTYTGGGGPETINPAMNATEFAFAQAVKSGQTYTVTVPASPPNHECNVTDKATGTVGGANITDVKVACVLIENDFVATGAEQTFVIPAGKTAVDVVLEGAQGGTNWPNPPTSPNYGGKLTATLAVTPGETLYIYVGTQPSDESGGFNGGGAGDNGGRGGGGATDIWRGGNALTDRILVAGGGGGAGLWTVGRLPEDNPEVVGGQGGGLTGGDGYRPLNNVGGGGGTQVGSALGFCLGPNVDKVSGGLGFGGTSVGKGCGCQGYGGGGGYYGGAGSGNCRGGGGGSGFAAAIADITNVVHTVGGGAAGNGRARITLK